MKQKQNENSSFLVDESNIHTAHLHTNNQINKTHTNPFFYNNNNNLGILPY